MLKPLSHEEITILTLLQGNALATNREIAEETDISESEVASIRDHLEKEQIILKYKAIVNWEKIESPEVFALIQVTVTPMKGQGYDEVARRISAFPEVVSCMLVSGAFDLLVEVQGPSLKDVAFFVADKLSTIEGVEHTRTNFLLKKYKQSGDLFTTSGKTHRLPVMI